SSRPSLAQSCPANPTEIGAASQYVFPSNVQPYIAVEKWFTMGRRAPVVWGLTNNGAWGMYLGSNPASPTPNLLEMSFRAAGPAGRGTVWGGWPGPTSLAVAESGAGGGRGITAWGGCGGPAEVMSLNPPGSNFLYDQRLDPTGTGGSPFPQTIAAALT